MAQATSPLLRLILALRRRLLRILKPQCVERALTGILRRLALLWRLCRSKLYPIPKGNDKPQKDELATPKDRVEGASSDQKSYTIIRHGDTISLDKASFSLYPFSSNGIRNTSRSSIRLGNPQSRSQSRSSHNPESNYAHSILGAGSVYDLPLNPTPVPSHTFSRNPRRQMSTSMPDLHISYDPSRLGYPIPSSSQQEQYTPEPRSPISEVGIEVTSPISPGDENEPVIRDPYHLERDQRTSNSSNQHGDYPTCSSPPPGINVEPMSPVAEGNSPGNVSETSLRVPSTSAHSTPHSRSHSRLSETTRTTPDIIADMIPLGPTSSRGTNDENHTIQPVMPDETKRYTRRTRTRKEWSQLVIDPVTINFERPAAPGGWLRFSHPEGARYFHHPVKRVYTESDLYDPGILDRLMDDIARLERLASNFPSFPENAVLMIDVDHRDGGGFETLYYYANHDARAIFFLHPIEEWKVGGAHEIRGIRTYRHLGYEMQSQYWYFVSLYPDSLDLTAPMVCELRDIVLYLIGDTMTSPFSTAPYTLEVLLQILGLTGEMGNNAVPGYPGTMAHYARHMYIFYHSRFLNFHGESYARLERDFSVFGDPLNKRTWLVKTLSFFLFSAPDVHLRNLQKMWVDGIMHQSVWKQTMKALSDEWQEFIFFATVMLTSNVGFLAIQSVDTDHDPFRSDAQILSYLSVVANTAALILGLLLMRQNRTKSRETAEDVQNFLTRRNHPRLGLETLAILYSLPYALLMWGVVTFLGAFCCVFFQSSNVQTRSLVGALAVAVAILIFWCIVTSWETKEAATEEKRPLAYEERQFTEYEDPQSHGSPPKYSIFDRIRSLPVLMYIRNSLDSGETTVV